MAKYYIFGHEVDKETYLRYENAKFEVKDVTLSLNGVRIWATGKEIEEELPDYAAAARTIYNEILNEIGAAGAVEAPNKKCKHFRGYIEELDRHYRDCREVRNKLVEAFERTQKRADEIIGDVNSSLPDVAIARGERAKASLEYQKGMRELQETYATGVREIRSVFEKHVNELYRATPDKLDKASIDLLGAGIMGVADVEHMASQFRHNPTMLKLIAKHSKELAETLRKENKNDDARKATALAVVLKAADNPDELFEGFDHLAEHGKKGVGTNSVEAQVYDNRWSAAVDSITKNYNDFIIQASTDYKHTTEK